MVYDAPMRFAWAICFVFTAVAFLLQAFPITGIFLLIFAAPFWSVVTINLGFILMIKDGVMGDLPRWALVFPALWFGGYAVATSVSHFEARSLANGILADNASKSLSFDPDRESLLFETGGRSLNAGYNFDLDSLVNSYALNTAYRRLETSKNCPNVQAVQLRSFGCAQGAGVVATDGNGCVTTTQSIVASQGPFRLLKGVCRAYTPVSSMQPTVTLSGIAVRSRKSVMLEAGITTYELKRSDGASVKVEAGYAYPLAWFPLPVVGCAPIDRWTCSAYFARDSVVLLGALRGGKRRGATDAVAGALKLPASSVTARFPERSG